MQAGEFQEAILRQSTDISHPGVLARHPDACSVTARYRNSSGSDVVEVHYYALPDGSVIPNKRPDPKLLFEDGVLYHQEKPKNRQQRLSNMFPLRRICHHALWWFRGKMY